MTLTRGTHLRGFAHFRHSVAGWRDRLSLRARLSLLVAVVIAAGIMGVSYLQIRVVEQTLERALVDSARSTAQTIAEDMEARRVDPEDVTDWLHDFIEANPSIRAITLITDEGPGVSVLASTSSLERTEARDLVRTAMSARRMQVLQNDAFTMVAAPIELANQSMGVVVTVSMAAVQQLRTEGRATALWFAPPAVALLAVLIDLLARRLVHRRIAQVLATMQRASLGDLTARTPVERRDELGALAEGLNEMLTRMERFNTDLQQSVREALARAERMAALGQLAANIAHQVGTPLNLISGYVQMLREAPLDRRAREWLAVVERQILQVTRVLRSMLDQTRQPSPREAVDVRRMIEHACDAARPRAKGARVHLNLRFEEPLPAIEADPTQLEAAVLNLITNSLDALPHGGTLTIHVGPTEEGVHIEVADSGPGFRAEILPRVFEPWVTTKPVGQGTGLGLGIAREVVRAHGGRIEAHNRPEGGACVTIDLLRSYT